MNQASKRMMSTQRRFELPIPCTRRMTRSRNASFGLSAIRLRILLLRSLNRGNIAIIAVYVWGIQGQTEELCRVIKHSYAL
jgi:hypothetical protein